MQFENFSFLIPGTLAGMAYPRSSSILTELVRLGFRSLIALGHPPSGPIPADLQVYHHELPDFTRIPVSELQAVVQIIDRAQLMVAVCCGSGIGRTGVALACYLVSREIGRAHV